MTVHAARRARRRGFPLMLALLGSLALAGHPARAQAPDDATPAGRSEGPRVLLQTNVGDIEVALFEDEAPKTVANFLRLVDKGFYQGLIFHRVIPGFMVQTGGYDEGLNHREPPGTVPNESANGLENATGTLAMARLSDPDSAGSQFYINLADNAHLNARPGEPGYTVFGRVVDGMGVVRQIEQAETTRKAGMANVPKTAIVIERARRR